MNENMNEKMQIEIERWKSGACTDKELTAELESMSETELDDAFDGDLTFGTAGLRGIMGAGTNRMNIYTVAKASQGLADYVIKNYEQDRRRIAISYDSRNRSQLFARITAGAFAANGIETYIYPELMPTPCLSWAVRKLACAAGVNVTASHNPAKYNGYKVYGEDGGQITSKAASQISAEIEKLDIFKVPRIMDFEEGLKQGLIKYIPEEITTEFIEAVRNLSVTQLTPEAKNVSIIYSPLNGAGLKPVLKTLRDDGYDNITVVKEQEQPDGDFPTCTYPNPERKEAMELGISYARECGAELVLATDPDCDRVGAAVRDADGEYVLLSGNEIGVLLFDYICMHRSDCRSDADSSNSNSGISSSNIEVCADVCRPLMIKTVVSTDMAERIAEHYGVRTVNVLTGFKYIGEKIGLLEAEGKKASFVFGFEESYGYLSGTHVRDKDGVNAAFLICEMFAYYKAQGRSLTDRLRELYDMYGYYLNTVHSYEFEGAEGFRKMQAIMNTLRGKKTVFAEEKVVKYTDYAQGVDGLPETDMIKFVISGGVGVIVRPSGTEPKLKVYISLNAADKKAADIIEKRIVGSVEKIMT